MPYEIMNDKSETVKQWSNDPCGIVGAAGVPLYTKEFYERIDKNRYQEYAPWMKEAMGFDRFNGKKVLEIGFGMGTDLFQFAEGGADVYGVDLTPRHLEIASKRFSLFNRTAHLQLADAESLPFADNTFDVVYTFGVIHHTPETDKAVGEIHRVLKPGGRAIIGLYHRNSIYYYLNILLPFVAFRFLFESYRRTLSRIEYRENSDACPLVKMVSRADMKELTRAFSRCSFECHHLEKSHFGPFRYIVPRFLLSLLERRFGWYLIAKCEK